LRIEAYFQRIAAVIASSPGVHSSRITYDKRTNYIGYVKGIAYMIDGSELHFREFVDVEFGVDRYTYAYHYQRDEVMIFRYDNTEHHRRLNLATFPHHMHDGYESNVISSDGPDLSKVLEEIEELIELF